METAGPNGGRVESAQHKRNLLLFLKVFCLSVVATCAFGVALDQVTTRMCFEYFSEGFHKVMIQDSWMQRFLDRYPRNCTVWGITWGIVASWWVGAILGVLLGFTAIVGRWPRLSEGRCTRLVVASVLLTALSVSSMAWYKASYFLEALNKEAVVSMCREYGFELAHSAEKLSGALEETGRRYLLCGFIHTQAYIFGELYGICTVAFALCWRAYMRYSAQA